MKKQIILMASAILEVFGAVNDIIPSDYEAPLVGSSVMSVNYLQKKLTNNTLPNEYITQQTSALRYTYGLDLDGKTLGLGIAIPYSSLKTNGQTLASYIGKESDGMSDSVLSATYWLKNERKNKEFLATTITLTIPSGKYDDSQILNSGENRYKTTFGMGYITKIADDFIFELSPELAFYSENKTTKTKQKPSYAISSNIRYKPNAKYELFLGAQENYQSETIKNNKDQNDDELSQKYSIGAFYYTDKFHQIMVRIATENNKQYGFSGENEVMLRYRWWFK